MTRGRSGIILGYRTFYEYVKRLLQLLLYIVYMLKYSLQFAISSACSNFRWVGVGGELQS